MQIDMQSMKIKSFIPNMELERHAMPSGSIPCYAVGEHPMLYIDSGIIQKLQLDAGIAWG
jgi:hypothetical protein